MYIDVNIILYKTFVVFAFYLSLQVTSMMMMMIVTHGEVLFFQSARHLIVHAFGFVSIHNVFTFLLKNLFLKIKLFRILKKMYSFCMPKTCLDHSNLH